MVGGRRDQRAGMTVRRHRRGFLTTAAGTLLLLTAAAGMRALLAPEATAPAAIGGPFTLVDGNGRPRSDTSFRGRFMLVFFGYTNCTDLCPKTLTEMSEALGRVDPEARRVQPIFITVDPARDTPERVQRYVAAFSPTLIGLTGTADQLGAVERRFHVVVELDTEAGRAALDHSAVIFLLGPDGRFVAPIPADAGRGAMQATLNRYVGTAQTDRS